MNIRVWDLPTRVFHWSLAACFLGLLVSGHLAGDAMVWHFRLGYAMLSLLLFRVVWGFVGGHWSRFTSFIPAPRTVWRYLRTGNQVPQSVGHNPLGALSVLMILGVLLLQVGTGLSSDDEVFYNGPLAHLLPTIWVQRATFFHTQVGKFLLIALAAFHLAAIAWYWLKRNVNLVAPMLDGNKQMTSPVVHSRDDWISRFTAAICFGLCCIAVAALVQWAQYGK